MGICHSYAVAKEISKNKIKNEFKAEAVPGEKRFKFRGRTVCPFSEAKWTRHKVSRLLPPSQPLRPGTSELESGYESAETISQL